MAGGALKENGLITLTWGNVSEIDRKNSLVVIKPSGISYDTMTPEDMVVVDLEGNKVDGKWNPSSDLPTHLELYRTFAEIGGVTHTHSRWAIIFSQAGKSIPMLGTTHADAFYGDIPCTRKLTPEEIASEFNRGVSTRTSRKALYEKTWTECLLWTVRIRTCDGN